MSLPENNEGFSPVVDDTDTPVETEPVAEVSAPVVDPSPGDAALASEVSEATDADIDLGADPPPPREVTPGISRQPMTRQPLTIAMRSPLFKAPLAATPASPLVDPNKDVIQIDLDAEANRLMAAQGVDPAKAMTMMSISQRDYYREIVTQYYGGKNAGFDEGILFANKMFEGDKKRIDAETKKALAASLAREKHGIDVAKSQANTQAKAAVTTAEAALKAALGREAEAKAREWWWKLLCLPSLGIGLILAGWLLSHVHISLA